MGDRSFSIPITNTKEVNVRTVNKGFVLFGKYGCQNKSFFSWGSRESHPSLDQFLRILHIFGVEWGIDSVDGREFFLRLSDHWLFILCFLL